MGSEALADAAIADSSLDALRAMMSMEPALEKRWSKGFHVTGSGVTLDRSGNVTGLDIGGGRLRRLSASEFTTPLSKSLLTLNLGATDLPLDSIKSIVASLRALQMLYLGGNGIGDGGVLALEGALGTSIRVLDLRYNDIGPEGCSVLSRIVGNHGNIKILHLEGNQISDDGAAALGQALSSPLCAVTELYLGDNGIGPTGASSLAGAMGSSSALVKLYLEGNQIGPKGAAVFSAALEGLNDVVGERVFRNLYVDNNGIGKVDMKRLANAINSETTIEEN